MTENYSDIQSIEQK